MKIIQVNHENLPVYLDLCQRYEAEFAPITGKTKDDHGQYALDTQVGGNVLGYLLYENRLPVGLAAIHAGDRAAFEVCEFYIEPDSRRRKLGMQFAFELFKMHRGHWEVKQLPAAGHAIQFWRKTIAAFTGNRFQEENYQDAYWGIVVRQQFESLQEG